MAHYMVTLVIETDPAEGDPGRAIYRELMAETHHAVSLVASSKIKDDPTDEEADKLHDYMRHAHGTVSWVLTG